MSQILALLLKLRDLVMLHVSIPRKYNIVHTESDLLADRCTASNIWENIASTPKGTGGGTMTCSAGLERLKAWEKADIFCSS